MSSRRAKETVKRWWMRVIFFVPLIILIVERMVGTANVLNNISYQSRAWDGVANDPQLVAAAVLPVVATNYTDFEPISSYSQVSLSNLTRSLHTKSCANDLHAVEDTFPVDRNASISNRRIPKIIHQTGRSRCMTKWLGDVTNTWRDRLPDYEYYFHDDEAVDRLLNQDWPMFPHLPLVSKCLSHHGTAKADLWRYLVLWEYGGIYADLDTSPNLFNGTTITDHHDGFFVIEQYHMLSQYFVAISPRHPVMFYAIQHVLANLVQQTDTGHIQIPHVTGPHALHQGFQQFMKDVGVEIVSFRRGALPVAAGLYVGTGNRSLEAAGKATNENEYVRRETIPRHFKVKEYAQMNMTHFTASQQAFSGKSCVTAMLEYITRQQEQERDVNETTKEQMR